LCPCYVPAAIEADLAPSFVRVARKLRRLSPAQSGADEFKAIRPPLTCLSFMMEHDEDNSRGVRKSALGAGLLPLLVDLLTLGDEAMTEKALAVVGSLIVRAPKGDVGANVIALVIGTAHLLNAYPLVAARKALDTLFNIGMAQPDLLAEAHTWGIEPSVERLTRHSDRGTAAAALRVKCLLFPENWQDVSSTPPPRILSGLLSSLSFHL
jgi:hypothetical protein